MVPSLPGIFLQMANVLLPVSSMSRSSCLLLFTFSVIFISLDFIAQNRSQSLHKYFIGLHLNFRRSSSSFEPIEMSFRATINSVELFEIHLSFVILLSELKYRCCILSCIGITQASIKLHKYVYIQQFVVSKRNKSIKLSSLVQYQAVKKFNTEMQSNRQ